MSSVLNALKKLEKEQPSSDVEHRQWLKKTTIERSLFDRLRQRLRFHRFSYGIWATVVFFFIGGMAIIISADFFHPISVVSFSGQDPEKPLPLSEPVLNNNQQRGTIPATIIPDQGGVTSSKIVEDHQKTSFESFENQISDSSQSAPTIPAEAAPLNVVTPASNFIKKQSLKKKTLEEQAARSPGEPHVLIGKVSSETVSTPSASHEKYTAEVLNDAAMKIQAISWNKTPSSRLAVIGRHVVRQGDRIEQYTVIQINQGNIILGKGVKRWKILF
ncbi:hypothetical protein [Desulfocicer niacini]